MTIEKSKIRRQELVKQPKMKCYVDECLCYGEEKIVKVKRNCLGDDNPCYNSCLLARGVTSIIRSSYIVFLINCQDDYNHKPNRSEMVKAITLCC